MTAHQGNEVCAQKPIVVSTPDEASRAISVLQGRHAAQWETTVLRMDGRIQFRESDPGLFALVGASS